MIWVFDKHLYIGSENLEVFEHNKAGIFDNYLGHTKGMTVLLNTGKDGHGRLSASKDGTIKVMEYTNIEREKSVSEPAIDMCCYSDSDGEHYFLSLSATGKLLKSKVGLYGLEYLDKDQQNFDILPQNATYISCACIKRKGKEDTIILISMTHVYIINTINQEVNTIKLKTNETPLKIIEWNTALDQNQISVEILFGSKRSDIMIDIKDMILYDSDSYSEEFEDLLSDWDKMVYSNSENTVVNQDKLYRNSLIKSYEKGRMDGFSIHFGGSKKLTILDQNDLKVGEFTGQGFEFVNLETTKHFLVALDSAGSLFELKIV